MNNILSKIGGRKTAIILLAMLLMAFQEKLGLTADQVQKIVYLALGGSGVIALEDSIGAISQKKKSGEE